MQKQRSASHKIYLAAGAAITWLAVVLQFYILVTSRANNGLSFAGSVVKFLSYFTILTNILVALCFTTPWLWPGSRWGRFFCRPGTLTATGVYISFVGLGYSLLLRHIWNPQGLQLFVDEALHTAVPVIFILYWLIFTPKEALHWGDVFPWLIYPLVYLGYTLVRGAVSGEYPYYFIDAGELGYAKALWHVVLLAGCFAVLSLLFVGMGKGIGKVWGK